MIKIAILGPWWDEAMTPLKVKLSVAIMKKAGITL